jgi:antitoxin component of MazEF toxin-antitoxin module
MTKTLGIWERKIRKLGNAYYISIPQELLKASGVRTGQPMTIELLSNGNIMIVNNSKRLEEEK